MPSTTKILVTLGIACEVALGSAVAAPMLTPGDLYMSKLVEHLNAQTSTSKPSTISASEEKSTVEDASSTTSSVVAWQGYQRPSINGVVQNSSITQTSAPGPASGRPTTKVTRFELDKGATYTSAGYSAPRVEVFGRQASNVAAPAASWPDPVGSTRWYTFSVYMPTDFITATDTKWLVLTQWKGLNGGSPPIALEVKRNQLRLGGARTNQGLVPKDGLIGALPKGKWTTLSVGLTFSTSASSGRVEVVRDGKLVLPTVHVSTMDSINGKPDPIYLKQGIYQDSAWNVSHVIYISSVSVSNAMPEAAKK